MRKILNMWGRVMLVALVSSLWAVSSQAHELQPTIGDLEVQDGSLVLTLEINLEAQLSGIDLDSFEDTDDAADNANYDMLRLLEPADLLEQMPALVAKWNAVPMVSVDGVAAPLTLDAVDIPEVGDKEDVRLSRMVLSTASIGDSVKVTWPFGAGEFLLRQQGVDDPFTGFVFGGSSTPELSLGEGNSRKAFAVFAEYIPVGFDHILPKGLDHILFVLGLFLLSTAWRPLLWQVTAFTAAHTVTLALGAVGWVNVPGSIVEPLIAASIVYVAVENIFARNMGSWRPVVIFGFGLLHGLGFASVLGDFGLPDGQFVPALIGFNIGVELGQLTVIGLAMALLWVSGKAALRARLPAGEAAAKDPQVMFRAVSIPGSLVIAGIGIWWVIERTLL